MAQHAIIDTAGAVVGFLDDRLHKQIPAGAVSLSQADYARWLANQKTLRWDAATSKLVALTPAEIAAAAPVPASVTMFAFKAHLLTLSPAPYKNLLDAVAAWATGVGGLTALTWSDATVVTRGGAFIAAAAAHFGWSSAETDQMFTAAAAIRA